MKKLILFCLVIFFTTKTARTQTQVTFYTNMGDFVVETYDTLQPITAGNFIDLVNTEFYDGLIFHRVVGSYIIQGGDPTGTGSGGPGYSIPDEFDPLTSNVQKAISMASAGPNTGGSQFFINLDDNLNLDPDFPVFGIVTTNFSVVESIGFVPTNASYKPLSDVIMDSLRVTYVGPHVGFNQLENNVLNLSISPNPASEQITIGLGDQIALGNGYFLNITNVLGRVVYSERLTQKLTTINTSMFHQKGIFFVNVTDESRNSITVKKVVLL